MSTATEISRLTDARNTIRDKMIELGLSTSTAKLDALATAVGGTSVAGTKLKSTTAWSSGAGTDDYGFSALPAGYYYGSFGDLGSSTNFWTPTGSGSSYAYCRGFNTGTSMYSGNTDKYLQFSVRLVKDSQSA